MILSHTEGAEDAEILFLSLTRGSGDLFLDRMDMMTMMSDGSQGCAH